MTPRKFKENEIEYKVGEHLNTLIKRLKYMESYKKIKPHYSQACDSLISRLNQLLGLETENLKNNDKPKVV